MNPLSLQARTRADAPPLWLRGHGVCLRICGFWLRVEVVGLRVWASSFRLHVLIAIQTPFKPFYSVRLDNLVWLGEVPTRNPGLRARHRPGHLVSNSIRNADLYIYIYIYIYIYTYIYLYIHIYQRRLRVSDSIRKREIIY